MNGVLWKWTNYYSGWQQRWFILKDGILSYYRSEEEVQSGSKGSINLSVCDLNVSNFDNTRFEIVIPGEQKYHLKASNIHERQRWIVAIGSCKACHTEPEFEVNAHSSIVGLPINEISSKESEMRLFMELMNQQVLSIKGHLSENQCPDINSINDLTSTLNAACDTFLASLKDLMSLIALNCSMLIDSPPTNTGSPVFSLLNSNGEELKIRKNSNYLSNNRFSMDNGSFSRFRNRRSISQEIPVSSVSINVENRRKTNFFFQMTHSFVDWNHLARSTNNISTMHYINSFWSLLHFLDNFDTSPIVSLKLDIMAYVKRLTQKYESDRKKFSTLQCIIKSEHNFSQLNVESATYVIRSLNRCLMFIEYFLQYLYDWISVDSSNDQIDENLLKTLLTRAYDATLENKLNWLDQGLFTIIIKSLPKISEFFCHLLCLHDEIDKPVNMMFSNFKPEIEQLLVDMNSYRNGLVTINSCLTQFFSDMKIEL